MSGLTGDGPFEKSEDFLARIREIEQENNNEDHDATQPERSEDKERTRKLDDEEIARRRQERAARRAERARSISPTKVSPAGGISSSPAPQPALASSMQSQPSMPPPQQSSSATVSSPLFHDSPKSGSTLQSQSSLSRSGTLSWQQRPESRGPTPTVRSRPLSTVAIENSSIRSPSGTPEPASFQEKDKAPDADKSASESRLRDSSTPTRGSPHPAAAMLASKDPDWFKQTPDRGIGSAAYRKSEEPEDGDAIMRGGSARLPGMSRESTADPERELGSIGSAKGRPQSQASPSLLSGNVRLDQVTSPDLKPEARNAMSPPPRWASPERMNRPASPTKGKGGFVESAMMKRSDSVSKRWSAQPGGGLSRGNSIVSNRGSRDLSQLTYIAGNVVDVAAPGGLSEKNDSRQASPVREKDIFVKAGMPGSADRIISSPPPEPSTSRPSSPVKDTKRWSPVKASWLENQINKTEPPKPIRSAIPQQPDWMTRLQKQKAARASTDMGNAATSAPGGDDTSKPASSGVPAVGSQRQGPVTATSPTELPSESQPSKKELDTVTGQADSHALRADATAIPSQELQPKKKPETPPKKDFRSNLRSHSNDLSSSRQEEPEFKKAFGNLKRAETRNYKAPDTLKENIMRGKTGLSVTDGPQQTKRVDEFKQSILAKKQEFSATPTKSLTRNPSQLEDKPVPEALAKRSGMINCTKSVSDGSDAAAGSRAAPPQLKPSSSVPETASSAGADGPQSKLAARFNPKLANILARGPPGMGNGGLTTQAQGTSSASDEPSSQKGPELTHQTKARARGPKRKPPKASQPKAEGISNKPSDTKIGPEAEPGLQQSSTESKLEAYNQIKLGLVGEISKPDAFGITGLSSSDVNNATAPTASNFQGSPRLSHAVEKSKPPMPRSPSTRVVSGNFSPKPVSKPLVSSDLVNKVTQSPKSVPLGTVPVTSNRVNASDAPSTPLRNRDPAQGGPVSAQKRPFSKVPSSPATGAARATPYETPKTPRQHNEGVAQRTPSVPVQVATNNSKSPPIPAKGAAARARSSGVASSATPITKADDPASLIVEEFFGPIPAKTRTRADIDTQSIINQATRSSESIRTLRKQIWQVSSDGEREPMPAQGEYTLFEECMYLCTHVFGSGDKRVSEVYLWIGDAVSPYSVENAQATMRHVAKEAGIPNKAITLRQGKESSNFFQALGGIIVTRKGSSQTAAPTHMLCGRKYLGQMAFDEVEFHSRSLCSGFSYIVAGPGGRLFLWKGKGATVEEIGCAQLIAMDLGLTGDVQQVDDGSEPPEFWEALGSSDRVVSNKPQHWHLRASKANYAVRLFAIDDARPKSAGLAAIQGFSAVWNRRPSAPSNDDPSTCDIRQIDPFSQNDLAQDGVFVLDAYFEVYVVLGWRSSARLPAFRSAMVFAQEYAILAASQEDRPFVPVAHVIFAGSSASYLKSAFRKWDDKRVTTQPIGSSNEAEMLPLHEALAAVTE